MRREHEERTDDIVAAAFADLVQAVDPIAVTAIVAVEWNSGPEDDWHYFSDE